VLRGMYSAISGLKQHQTMLDVTANDIANVNTIGYKGSRTTFTDQLSQLQAAASAPGQGGGGRNPGQVGLGVQFGSIDNSMGGGALQSTSNVLDLAVQGDGWFRVTTDGPGADPTAPEAPPATAEGYTRAGNFTRNSAGYLVTQNGAYLLGKTPDGTADSYLRVPDGASNMSIGADGQVTYLPGDPADPAPLVGGGPRRSAGFLSLAKFANEGGLERASTNLWRVSAASGPEAPASGALPGTNGLGSTVSGVVEMSNVDLATEFTELISAQRGFQANSRVISTSDEMLQELTNLKR
jgi:flagellar hook protein FlgE